VHLLYSDDRQEARQTAMLKDGSFSFAYVPAGNYILRITDAQDAAPASPPSDSAPSSGADPGASPQTAPGVHKYMDKEMPLDVQGDIDDVHVTLVEPPPPPQANQ